MAGRKGKRMRIYRKPNPPKWETPSAPMFDRTSQPSKASRHTTTGLGDWKVERMAEDGSFTISPAYGSPIDPVQAEIARVQRENRAWERKADWHVHKDYSTFARVIRPITGQIIASKVIHRAPVVVIGKNHKITLAGRVLKATDSRLTATAAPRASAIIYYPPLPRAK